MRIMSTIRYGGLIVASLWASIVVAQENLSVRDAEVELAGYADCVVARKSFRKPVADFLRVIPGSAGFFAASMKAADMTCLNSAAVRRHLSKLELRIQPETFRNALYPALYRRDFGKRGPVSGLDARPPISLSAEFDGDLSSLPALYRPERALGDCIARANPTATHAMLVSVPYSSQEGDAVGLLKPTIATCLPQGQSLHLTRGTLRAVIGEAMYKLSALTPST
jgi:hypothetical protein